MKYFENIKNKIDFFLRERFGFSRRNYYERPEEKQIQSKREKELLEKYALQNTKENTTVINYLETLYILDLLDKTLKPSEGKSLKILDVGCKNWTYAKGEYLFFKKHSDKITLHGIEIDANRLYSTLYSRAEIAKFHIKNIEGAKYFHKDFLKHKEKYDYIVWILPFIFENPHLKWGLPKKYFKPEEMLIHAYNSLSKGGEMLIINQGEVEYEKQKKLCEKLKIPYKEIGKTENEFLDLKYSRYGIIIKN